MKDSGYVIRTLHPCRNIKFCASIKLDAGVPFEHLFEGWNVVYHFYKCFLWPGDYESINMPRWDDDAQRKPVDASNGRCGAVKAHRKTLI